MYELVGSDNVSRLLEDSGRKMFTDFNRTRPKTMLAIHACFFFWNGTAPTETYTLSLHDALPISAVAGFLDVVSNRAVDLPACHSLAHGGGLEHSLYPRIAAVADDLEDLALFVGRCFADEAGPGDVVVDRAGRVFLCPDIEQHEVSFANWSGAFSMRFVVRIAAVGIYGHDGRVVRDEVLATKGFHEPLLHRVLGRAAVARPEADLLKGRSRNVVDRITRGEVRLHLFIGKSGFKLRDQVGGTYDVLTKTAHDFYGACVDQGDREHAVVGRVLHGDVAVLRKDRLEAVEESLPARVASLGTRQCVQMPG